MRKKARWTVHLYWLTMWPLCVAIMMPLVYALYTFYMAVLVWTIEACVLTQRHLILGHGWRGYPFLAQHVDE